MQNPNYENIRTNEKIKYINNKQKDKVIIKKEIENLFYLIGFNSYSKGAPHFKKAIYIAYKNQSLIYNTKHLIKIVSRLSHTQESTVRSAMDYSLYSYTKYVNMRKVYAIFGAHPSDKLTPKIFIILCINYLNRF